MIVEVTQEDIDNGKKQNIYSCPISLAAARRLRKNTMVTGSGIEYVGLSQVRYNFAKSTREKLIRYDATGKMKPFRFRIRVEMLQDLES